MRRGVAEFVVERVVPGGDGLARVDGVVTLVPGAFPGDRVRARLVPEGSSLLRGELLAVVEAGPDRRPEPEVCPRALDGSCGGCDWAAARPGSSRALKTALVLDALRRVGRLDSRSLPSPAWLGSAATYRLRSRLHVDGLGRAGFLARRSSDVSDLEACEVVSGTLLERLPAVRAAFLSAGGFEGELVTLEGLDGTPLLGELRPARAPRDPEGLLRALHGPLDGVLLLDRDGNAVARRGTTALVLDVDGARFRVSVSSFFQANRHLLSGFLGVLRSAVAPAYGAARPGRAVDLYAGVGFLTRPVAEAAGSVTAVEVSPSSSDDLRANAGTWRAEGLAPVEVHRSSAEAFAAGGGLSGAELVVADPPREGLSPAVRRAISRAAPGVLVLVSCDPATFARDLAFFSAGYDVETLTLLDLFPGTHHVECVARLVRRGPAAGKG